jgi:hypothetical protein
VLPTPGIIGRQPAAVAARDVVSGVNVYARSHKWPAYLPPVVRNRLAVAVASSLRESEPVMIAVEEDGHIETCEIGAATRDALQEPELYRSDSPVVIVGEIFDLNNRAKTFKMAAGSKNVTVQVDETQFEMVSETLRWVRVVVQGYPLDEACRTLHQVEEIRLAATAEEDGMVVPRELQESQNTPTYRAVEARTQRLLRLENDWDGYRSKSPAKRPANYGLRFLADAIGVLSDFGIEVPTPFVVPTPSGGMQLEWQVGKRELELEIPESGRFEFLAVNGEETTEGEASRWLAVRLLRWVISGEPA